MTPVAVTQGQRAIHVVAEIVGLTVVAPILGSLALKSQFSRRQRWFLGATALGTALVDGYLLFRWAVVSGKRASGADGVIKLHNSCNAVRGRRR